MRVLEIGTGTGYNAALLCHRLGDANVFSVDLDPDLITTARRALDSIGLHPNGTSRVVVSSPTSQADIHLTAAPGGTWPTEQRGIQRLWDTVEHAIGTWTKLDRPDRTRLGISAPR